MPERIPQSVALRVQFPAYLSSDHVGNATGKTIAMTISKNGGAFGNPSAGATNATEIANGEYYVDLSTTDTGTLGPLVVRGTAGTIDDVKVYYNVVKATNAGYSALPDAAAEAAGGLYTRGSGAGQLSQTANGELGVATLAKTVTTYTGNTVQTGDAYARLGAPAGASVSADVAAVKGVLPTALVSGRIDASVGAMASAVLTAAAIAADAITDAKVASDVTIASVTGAVGSVTGNVGGNVTGSVGSVVGAVGSVTGLTVANLDATISSRASAANLATVAGYLDTEIADIKAKTDLIPASPAAVGSAMTLTAAYDAAKTAATQASVDAVDDFLDTEIAAIKAKTDNLPADPADASDVAASIASLASTLSTIAGYIDTEVAAIKAKTDNLPSDPADASDIAASFATVSSTLATIAAYIDTEVAAIKVKTDRLTFTSGNDLDVNVQKVNDVALLGDGSATPWGPA